MKRSKEKSKTIVKCTSKTTAKVCQQAFRALNLKLLDRFEKKNGAYKILKRIIGGLRLRKARKYEFRRQI